MKMYRIMIDIEKHDVYVRDCDAFELEPGELIYRASDRSLRPLTSDSSWSSCTWVSSGWHAAEKSARIEAGADLDRRIDAMRQLADRCRDGNISRRSS